MNLVPSENMAFKIADEVTVTPGFLFGAKVRLFQNDVQPVYGSDGTEFDVATYAGYADKTVTWLETSIDDQGLVEVIGTVPEFRPTGSATPNGIFGAEVLTSTSTYLMAGRFDGAPLPMESSTDAIVLTIRYRPIDQSIAIVIS